MKINNWQPKLIGVVTAAAAFIEFDPSLHFPGWVESLSKFVMIGGLAGLGLTTKQSNVTGGTVLNKKNDPQVSNTGHVETSKNK